MKNIFKLLLTLTVVCTLSPNVEAQQYQYQTKHQFAVSYGVIPNSAWISAIEDVETIVSSVGLVGYDNDKDLGAISVEYLYQASDLVAVGATGVYAHTTKDIIFELDKSKGGTATSDFITIMPVVKFDWLRRESVGLYSKFSAGVSVIKENQEWRGADDYKHTSACFNFQASLIGVEAGNTNIRAFAELGVGEQGMAVVGVRFRF